MEIFLIISIIVIVGVNILSTFSPRFRRWLYED